MSIIFEKLVKEAIRENCNHIQLDNESDGFIIYLITNGSGFPADLNYNEIFEIKNYLKKIKKTKGNFVYSINNKDYNLNVKFRNDFGEEVFTLKIKS